MAEIGSAHDRRRLVRYQNSVGRYFESFLLVGPAGSGADVVGAHFLGQDVEGLLGRPVVEMVHPDDRDRCVESIERWRQLPGRAGSLTVRVRSAIGSWTTVEMLVRNELDDPSVGGLVVALHDVSGRPVADRVMALGEYLYRRLATTATDFSVILDADGSLSYLSPSVTAVLGWQPCQLPDLAPMELVHADDRSRLRAELEALTEEVAAVRRVDVRCLRPDGSWLWVELTLANLVHDPVVAGVALHARNIDERRRAADRLFHLALHDPLTGLPNRQQFHDHVDALGAEPSTCSVTVLYCDLVGFKAVNDRLGHAAGDELLRHTAQRLRRTVRPADLVARIGGDEFCVVCADLDLDLGAELAQRIVGAFGTPIELEGVAVSLGISVGVARSDVPVGAGDLLGQADAAMYRAKARDSHRHELWLRT